MAGYYECSVSPEDGKKDPWFIHADGTLWAAGLWEDTSPLLDPDNLGNFTVITGDSSGVSADIHDRMTVWTAPSQLAKSGNGLRRPRRMPWQFYLPARRRPWRPIGLDGA
jgi:putative SOS response-associated peptidase YedK